jgi:hypothetical protein
MVHGAESVCFLIQGLSPFGTVKFHVNRAIQQVVIPCRETGVTCRGTGRSCQKWHLADQHVNWSCGAVVQVTFQAT